MLAGLAAWQRGPLLTWLAINVPRITGGSVEQQIGFARTSDGVQIAYATSGDGPPLVLVLGWLTHLTEGFGSPLYDQAGVLAWWSRENRLVRYDGRGFGLSDRDVSDFSLDARVEDLETVVEALGLERFVLYGYSAGGPTAIEYAVRHPERVRKLVLAATFVERGEDRSRSEGLQGLTHFIETAWDSTQTARAALTELLAPEADEVQRRILMHFLGVAAEAPQIAGFMRQTGALKLAERAREVRVPTLVIASDADTTVALVHSRRVASLIPGARLEIVPGASHVGASLMDPRVLQLVADFVAERDLAGR